MRGKFATALSVVFAVGLVASGAAHAAEPIEGTWLYGGGKVIVEPTGFDSSGTRTFEGRVTVPTRFLECVHTPLEGRMWTIAGGGLSYTGTHEWFALPDCTPAGPGAARWTVSRAGGLYRLRFCTAQPGAGPPATTTTATTRCTTLTRIAPAVPRPRQICLAGVCVVAPRDVTTIGCLRRGALRNPFLVRVRDSAKRRYRIRLVRFTLDGRRDGIDRRAPYIGFAPGSRLRPGKHLLTANVTLRDRRTGRLRHVHLKYRFPACR